MNDVDETLDVIHLALICNLILNL